MQVLRGLNSRTSKNFVPADVPVGKVNLWGKVRGRFQRRAAPWRAQVWSGRGPVLLSIDLMVIASWVHVREERVEIES